MRTSAKDEWRVIESLLPAGWREAARTHKAFRRARYTTDEGALLRVLLLHAANGGGLRETAAQARAAGVARMSAPALLKRLRASGPWLEWLAGELCAGLRDRWSPPEGLRPRVVDGTTVRGPASEGTDWRIHYALDLVTLQCDWCEATDGGGGERLGRTPMRAGDVLLADRNYFTPAAVSAASAAGAYVLLRLRWSHPRLLDERGDAFRALEAAQGLKVGSVGAWRVRLPEGTAGRVVAVRLPAPLADKARRRVLRRASRTGVRPRARSLRAAGLVLLFTTLPEARLRAGDVLELYRHRWQIEVAFKRLKQLLALGRVPHRDPLAARSWILAKLVVALLLETLYRNAAAFSPWGFPLRRSAPRAFAAPA